jgi:hydrogenase maturation protease
VAEPRAAVIALGNPLRADDGAGPAVLDALAGRVPDGVRLARSGGDPAELLEAFDGLERVVLVDAVRTGAPAGTLHRFDAAAGPLPARTAGASTHALGLAEALELARALGRLPASTLVVGIEAAGDETGRALSARVAASVEPAAALVLDALAPAPHG